MTAPLERLAQFQTLRNVANDFKAGLSQSKRRQDALARQKEKRQQAFSLSRGGLDSVLDDLGLGDSSSDGGDDEADQPDKGPASGQEHGNGQFEDADESGVTDMDAPADDHLVSSEASDPFEGKTGVNQFHKTRTSQMPKRIKKKYRLYANRLMQGEDLDMDSEGLPQDLAGEWLAIGPVPKGKRCMVVTFNSTRKSQKGRVTNAILLSRTSGKPIVRQHVPVLPADCVLDCIYSAEAATLFCVDVLQWKRQSVAESDAEFRMFWRDSKLAELPMQTVPIWPQTEQFQTGDASMNGDESALSEAIKLPPRRPSHLLIVPIPCVGASEGFTKTLSEEIVIPTLSSERAQMTLSTVATASPGQTMEHIIPYQTSGISLLVRSAAYESGLTPLAAWVPKNQLRRLADLLNDSQ